MSFAFESDQSTSASLMTSPGRGAIAAIRVEGPKTIKMVAQHFQAAAGKPLQKCGTDRPVFGTWHSQDSGLAAEDLIVWVRSDRVVEVQCHGGPTAVERVLSDLESAGASVVDWGQQRPAGNTAEQALLQLPFATTQRVAAILNAQANGALDNKLTELVGLIENGQKDSAINELSRLLELSGIGLHLTRPWSVLIAGPPNVGKSCLINRILGFDRSIVYDQPGTTRDLLTAKTALGGWPFQFIDTAGIREVEDSLEQQGIKFAEDAIRQADLILAITEIETLEIDQEFAERLHDVPHIQVINKCDLASDATITKVQSQWQDAIVISALTGQNIDTLIQRIVLNTVGPAHDDQELLESAVPFLAEQTELLNTALRTLQDGSELESVQLLQRLRCARIEVPKVHEGDQTSA